MNQRDCGHSSPLEWSCACWSAIHDPPPRRRVPAEVDCASRWVSVGPTSDSTGKTLATTMKTAMKVIESKWIWAVNEVVIRNNYRRSTNPRRTNRKFRSCCEASRHQTTRVLVRWIWARSAVSCCQPHRSSNGNSCRRLSHPHRRASEWPYTNGP